MGTVLTGKVTGITKFGAFVTVAPGKSGLVHISEIANSYVSDVHDHLTDGQEVKVKVIGIDQSGRINLSIKAALPPAPPPTRQNKGEFQRRTGGTPSRGQPQRSVIAAQPAVEPSFEDKLKRFMQDSDNKISGIKMYSERKGSRRRGR